jgi:hypothetical protein
LDFSKAADQPPHSYQHFLQARHFPTDKNCSEGSGLKSPPPGRHSFLRMGLSDYGIG